MTALIRTAAAPDLQPLLALYRHLSPEDPVLSSNEAAGTWRALLASTDSRVLLAEVDGTLVSSCVLTVVANLSRGARPYALIENVVTHGDHRRHGHGTAILRAALDAAWAVGCYKVMLATGSKRESTLRFYEAAGFTRGGKTFFQARKD